MDAFYFRFFPGDGDAVTGYHRVLDGLLPETGDVLDLGCGDNGQLARYRNSRRSVWGADFQMHPQLKSPEWFRLLEAGDRIPFPDASFDTVATCWVLEHVAAPEKFLGEVRRVLRPGGSFVGLTINGHHYVTGMIRLIHALPHGITRELVSRLYGRAHHDTFPTHYRLNTTAQLRRSAQSTGMGLTSIVRYANPDYFSFCTTLCHAAVVTDWCLEKAYPGLGKLYMVVTLQNTEPVESSSQFAA